MTRKVRLIPGPSQRIYALAGVGSWVTAVVGGILGLVVISSPVTSKSAFITTPITVAVVLLGLSGLGVFALLSKVKAAKEAEAGYTTATRLRQDLPQVDNVSGCVIREAGEPFLKGSDMKIAYRRARGEGS